MLFLSRKTAIRLVLTLLPMSVFLAGCDRLGESLGVGPESRVKAVRDELDRANIGHAGELLAKIEASYPEKADVILLRAEYEAVKGNAEPAVQALRHYIALVPSGIENIKSSSRFKNVEGSPEFIAFLIKADLNKEATINADDGASKEVSEAGGGVSISESGDRQEIRAGDISISVGK
jgi:hypothetical protein